MGTQKIPLLRRGGRRSLTGWSGGVESDERLFVSGGEYSVTGACNWFCFYPGASVAEWREAGYRSNRLKFFGEVFLVKQLMIIFDG